MNWIDIAFLATVALLVFNGLRNGALMSLVGLLALPIGFVVAFFFGPQFAATLAGSGLSIAPMLAYIVLFFGTILILHILGNLLRGVVKKVPIVSQGDALLGAVIGFIEAWLIWLLLLYVFGAFLNGVREAAEAGKMFFQGIDFSNFKVGDFNDWCNAYNDAISNSLFARVNGFFITIVPTIKAPERV